MFSVTITEKGGEQRRVDFDKTEVTIGRVQGNDIILPKGNVSKRHSRIVLKDGKFIIVDLKSTNGTYVNGRKITSPLVIKPSDKIYIGDFILAVEDGEGAAVAPGAGAAQAPKKAPPPMPARAQVDDGEDEDSDELEAAPAGAPKPVPEIEDDEDDDKDDDIPAPPPKPANIPVAKVAEPSRPIPAPAVARTMPPPVRSPAPAREMAESATGPAVASAVPVRRPAPTMPPAPPPAARPALASTEPAAAVAKPKTTIPTPRERERDRDRESARLPTEAAPAIGPDGKRDRVAGVQREILERLGAELELPRIDPARLGEEDLWEKAENSICNIVEQLEAKGAIPPGLDQDKLINDVLNEALGLGPLEDLLADGDVTQIFVNRIDQIFAEKSGKVVPTGRSFSSEKALAQVAWRMIGRRPGDSGPPMGEGRLADGSRVTVVLPPMAVRGPCITVRKLRREPVVMADLVKQNALSANMVETLELALKARRNIVVAGTSGGQGWLVAALGSALAGEERVVSIEDVAALDLRRDNWVQLEANPPHVGMRELLHTALRLRPDRLVVGDVRGAEALELVQALATGCDGVIIGLHAVSPRDAVGRMETLMQSAASSLPGRVARELIAQGIHLVVQTSRQPDGGKRVTSIVEVSGGAAGEDPELHEVFVHKGDAFAACGYVPRFVEEMQKRGVSVNAGLFKD
jgi:pilus assembly protein CpaF